MMDEVDDEAFDVRSVLILISHDHDPAVAQRLERVGVRVLLIVTQSHDFDNVVDLRVFITLQTVERNPDVACCVV